MALVRNRLFPAALAVMGTVALAACSALVGASPNASGPASASPTSAPSAVSSPSASSSPATPTPSPSASGQPGIGQVAGPAQAAALVLASNPRFANVRSQTPGLIGASAWYEASLSMDGNYSVAVTLGSGDCQAGCINQHTWHYSVTPDGTVSLISDEGDAVDYQPPAPTSGMASVRVTVQAGPVCPVEQNPPASACAPRKVAGAQIVVHSPDGVVVAQATTDENGTATLQLTGGAYWIEAKPVQGLMATPSAQAFSVVDGYSTGVVLEFDTGIR